ncbi:hypothetical protein SB861_36640 [Paraburkholderia sp. SIMBA_049]
MPCIAIHTCESVIGAAVQFYTLVKRITSMRVSKILSTLGHFGPATLVTLNADGALTSRSLTDISLAVIVTLVTGVLNRFKAANRDLPPTE